MPRLHRRIDQLADHEKIERSFGRGIGRQRTE
jgi:hypothetical protein